MKEPSAKVQRKRLKASRCPHHDIPLELLRDYPYTLYGCTQNRCVFLAKIGTEGALESMDDQRPKILIAVWPRFGPGVFIRGKYAGDLDAEDTALKLLKAAGCPYEMRWIDQEWYDQQQGPEFYKLSIYKYPYTKRKVVKGK